MKPKFSFLNLDMFLHTLCNEDGIGSYLIFLFVCIWFCFDFLFALFVWLVFFFKPVSLSQQSDSSTISHPKVTCLVQTSNLVFCGKWRRRSPSKDREFVTAEINSCQKVLCLLRL